MPPYAAVWASLENTRWLDQSRPALASAIKTLPWVADGIDEGEEEAAQELAWLAFYESTFGALMDKAWVEDGLNEDEFTIVQNLRWTAQVGEAPALRILAMPFLELVEPADAAAVTALRRLIRLRPQHFESVMSHPTLSGGITDDWAKIVAVLYGVSRTNPRLIDVLLDPDRVILEERVVNLPRTGLIDFAIIRTGPGAARSMDLLEYAAYSAESFMAAAFPTKYVALLFENAVPGYAAGANFGGHIAVRPEYDVDDGSYEAGFAGHLIAHEVAHYYWLGNSDWVDEGASDFMASVSENARTGRPVGVTKPPCGYARTIAELERLAPVRGEAAFTCNYALGERLFLDLHRGLIDFRFRNGFRDLYRLSQVEDDDDAPGTAVGLDHLKTAFAAAADIAAPVVDVIANRWYYGTEPYGTSARDISPVDPNLYTVNGRIEQAYVAAARNGPPTSRFSARAGAGWVWLFLDYDYAVSAPREVELELVDYFEDGFVFDRRTVSFTAQPRI